MVEALTGHALISRTAISRISNHFQIMDTSEKASAREIVVPFSLLPVPQQFLISALASSSSLSAFLRRFPDRAYITILTRNGRSSIPALDTQITRLLHSGSLLYGVACLPNANAIRNVLISAACILAKAIPCDSINEPELRMVIILDDVALYIHADRVQSMPTTQTQIPSIRVEVRGSARTQPIVKNTRWVTQREPLEKTRGPDFTETILHDQGALLEGLISNFFVVTDTYTVITAPDNVIYPGTMRSFVIQACQRLDIPVVLASPEAKNWTTFRAAFITNAAQMLTPISSITFQNYTDDVFKDVPKTLILDTDSPAARLVDGLRECVKGLTEFSLTETGPAHCNWKI